MYSQYSQYPFLTLSIIIQYKFMRICLHLLLLMWLLHFHRMSMVIWHGKIIWHKTGCNAFGLQHIVNVLHKLQ